MSLRSCSECRIQRAKACRWVKERNMAMIGRCVTDPGWGGACATCAKNSGVDPNPALQVCRGCLANTRRGTTYFLAWSQRR